MFRPQPTTKYTSKGLTISKSLHHPGLYIVDSGEKFFAIQSSDELIQKRYPKDKK